MKIGEISLKWLGHSGFLIENSSVIYIDPFQIKDDMPKADFILFLKGSAYSSLSNAILGVFSGSIKHNIALRVAPVVNNIEAIIMILKILRPVL